MGRGRKRRAFLKVSPRAGAWHSHTVHVTHLDPPERFPPGYSGPGTAPC